MQHKLPQTTTIGRSKNCDIQVHPKNTKVSREHAEIKIHKNNMYVLYDKSARGTFVNGKKEKQIVLKNGDNINLGGALKLNFSNGVLSSSSPGIQLNQSSPAPIPVAPLAPPMPAPMHQNPPPHPQGTPSQQRQYIQHQTQRISTGYKISTSGAIVVIIFFFMPWVHISLFDIGLGLNGWKFAAGYAMDDILGDLNVSGFANLLGVEAVGKLPGEPIIFIILIAAVLVLPLFFFSYQRNTTNLIPDGIGVIVLGIIPLLMLLFFYSNMKDLSSQLSFLGISSVKVQLGLWGTILGHVAITIGGILNLLEASNSSKNTLPRFQINNLIFTF